MRSLVLYFVLFLLISVELSGQWCNETFELFTQNDVDSFQIKHGPCDKVKGLIIGDFSGRIKDLSPLLGIKNIGGLRLNVDESLVSLKGLDSLSWVGFFQYKSKYKIDPYGIRNLDTIETISHYFEEANNDLSIYRNVKYVDAFQLSNSGLLSGMDSLKVNDDLKILISSNDAELSLENLLPENQRGLGLLWIIGCNNVFSMKGMERLKFIKVFGIFNSTNIVLKNITSIKKCDYFSLVNLNYFKGLEKISENIDTLQLLSLTNVDSFKSLGSLFPNLNQVVGYLYLGKNKDLKNISLIQDFPLPHYNNIKHLYYWEGYRDCNIYIKDNPKLNYCNYDIFCRAINTYPDSILLEGNGEDCTYESISEFCKGYVPLTNIFDTICNGDYYKFGDFVFDEAGYYLDTLQDRQGEDSIVLALNLVVNPSDSIYIDTLICQGNTINVGKEEISEQGIYEFELQNRYGCDSLIVVDVAMSEMEIDTVEIIPDYGCDNGVISLSVEGNNPPYAFTWSNGKEGESIAELSEGEYKVTIIDKSNCEYETENFIISDSVAYMIPNMFFPGGAKDDINGTFKTYLGRDTKILSTEIYSRWGEKVFYAEDDTPWDGTYKGVQSPPGVYLYKIVIESPCGTKPETGQVMLLR